MISLIFGIFDFMSVIHIYLKLTFDHFICLCGLILLLCHHLVSNLGFCLFELTFLVQIVFFLSSDVGSYAKPKVKLIHLGSIGWWC